MTEPAGKSAVLVPTECAICGTTGQADELYAPTFDEASFNERVFSARRLPDRIHYRIVRCRTCGLIRSDPTADPATLTQLYARSSFDYGAEVAYLRRTYGRYLTRAKRLCGGQSFLEVGCGNGFMLEEALSQGYQEVRGVEPSRAAIAAAAPAVRDRIVDGMMRPGLFQRATFDTVCLFQVFDHLPDPGSVLDQVRTVLKPAGVLLCFHHNVQSFSARLLGERSPIVDIEHCYLYSPATMNLLLEKHGFEILQSGVAANSLSLRHLVHLLPVSPALKRGFQVAAERTRAGGIPLRLRLGNLFTIAKKV